MPAKPDVSIRSKRCRFERASAAGFEEKRRYFDIATNGRPRPGLIAFTCDAGTVRHFFRTDPLVELLGRHKAELQRSVLQREVFV